MDFLGFFKSGKWKVESGKWKVEKLRFIMETVSKALKYPSANCERRRDASSKPFESESLSDNFSMKNGTVPSYYKF